MITCISVDPLPHYVMTFYPIYRTHQVGNGSSPHEMLHSTVGGWEEKEGVGQGGVPRLVVMDLRSYTATLGNRAKGGGSECTGGCG